MEAKIIISSVEDVVKALQSNPNDHEAKQKANNLLSSFNGLYPKSEKSILKIAKLAAIPEYESDVITALQREFEVPGTEPSVRMRLLTGLFEANFQALLHTEDKSLIDQDNLLSRFKLVGSHLSNLHAANPNVMSLLTLIRGFARLIDEMVDADVIDLKKFELKNPVYEMLTSLIGHQDSEVSYLACYARQGLIHIPSDETKPQLVYRKAKLAAEGLAAIGSIASAITKTVLTCGEEASELLGIPMHIFTAIEAFEKTFHFKEKKRIWYTKLRTMDVYIDNALKNDPKLEVQAESKKGDLAGLSVNFLKGYVLRLEELATRKPDILEKIYFQEIVRDLFSYMIDPTRGKCHPLICGKIIKLLLQTTEPNSNIIENINGSLSEQWRTYMIPNSTNKMDSLKISEESLTWFVLYSFVLALLNQDVEPKDYSIVDPIVKTDCVLI